MVFEPSAAPRDHQAFVEWYHDQTNWAEPHRYDDPKVASPRLTAWFADMIKTFPPMNGPLRSNNIDDPRVTDYSIGSTVIYAAFAWSQAEQAYAEVRRLATIHRVGFFDVSGDGEIVFPAS
jgi:predicted GH43/DUF377 family glycosyl hydrolase